MFELDITGLGLVLRRIWQINAASHRAARFWSPAFPQHHLPNEQQHQTSQRAVKFDAMADPAIEIPVHSSTSSTPSLCARCEKFRIDTEDDPDYATCSYPVTAEYLSQGDCEVCQIFWNSFTHCFPKYDGPSILFSARNFGGQLQMGFHSMWAMQEHIITVESGLEGIMLYRCPGT